jgi:fructosamine-3-kinase
MLTAEKVKDIAQRWAEYPILQELAASHEELRADLAAAEQREKAVEKSLVRIDLTCERLHGNVWGGDVATRDGLRLIQRQARALLTP